MPPQSSPPRSASTAHKALQERRLATSRGSENVAEEDLSLDGALLAILFPRPSEGKGRSRGKRSSRGRGGVWVAEIGEVSEGDSWFEERGHAAKTRGRATS